MFTYARICYLYWSCALDETDPYVKQIWQEHLEMELAHLHRVAEMLQKYEGKHYLQVLPDPTFPPPLTFGSNKEYVREKITTANLTSFRENYCLVNDLPKNADFFKFQDLFNKNLDKCPSHKVINMYIEEFGEDFRYQDKEHPIPELRDRTTDNTCVGRCPK